MLQDYPIHEGKYLEEIIFKTKWQQYENKGNSVNSLGKLIFYKIHVISIFHVYLPTPSNAQDMTQCEFLKQSFKRWKFFFLNQSPYQDSRVQSALLFTHSRIENSWIYTFPKSISAIWNAKASVRFWPRVPVFISFADNHYTTSASYLFSFIYASNPNDHSARPDIKFMS